MDEKQAEELTGNSGAVMLYVVTIGKIRPYAIGWKRRAQIETIEYIRQLDGFVAALPAKKGTLLLFETEKQAVNGRLGLMSRECPVGEKIGQAVIATDLLEKMKRKKETEQKLLHEE